MRTRREIKADIRVMRRIVKNASVADDGEDFIEKRRVLDRLYAERDALDAPPPPVLRALPPAARTWTPQRTTRAGETEEQKQRRLRGQRIDARTGARSNIGDEGGDARREEQSRKGLLHTKGLIRRSAMHQAR